MDYNISSDSNSFVLPHNSSLVYKGLTLIGRDRKDWNLPIQQNFVTLRDMIDAIISGEAVGKSLVPTLPDNYSLGSVNKPFKELYLGAGSFYINGMKVVALNDSSVTVASGDKFLKFKTLDKDIEIDAGTSDLVIKSDIKLDSGKKIGTNDSTNLIIDNGLLVEGDINCLRVNGIVTENLAFKSEIPDISGKLNKSEQKTKVSQMENDVGYLTAHQNISNLALKTSVATDIGTAVSNLKGGVPSTHDNLMKIKTALESASTAMQVQINSIKSILASDTDTLDTLQEIVSFTKNNKAILDNMAVATQFNLGWMSSADKVKLDNIETGATKYVHPSHHTTSDITGLDTILSTIPTKVAKNSIVTLKIGGNGLIIA